MIPCLCLFKQKNKWPFYFPEKKQLLFRVYVAKVTPARLQFPHKHFSKKSGRRFAVMIFCVCTYKVRVIRLYLSKATKGLGSLGSMYRGVILTIVPPTTRSKRVREAKRERCFFLPTIIHKHNTTLVPSLMGFGAHKTTTTANTHSRYYNTDTYCMLHFG